LPTLPWTTPNPARPSTQALVMASRFEVQSFLNVPRFFLKSLLAWGQVRSAPGALGASLVAQPMRRVFFTLSAWEDKGALYAYAKTEPHHSIMRGLRSTMRTSTFTFWDVPVEELPISWEDAKRRLAEQARSDASETDHARTGRPGPTD
jgi:heme-degrading monooxygenase HmoA